MSNKAIDRTIGQASPPPGKAASVLGRRLGASLIIQLSLLMLAILYTFYFARVLLIPLTAALVLHQLLYSPARWLSRHGLPSSAAAGLVLFGLFGLIGVTVHFLSEPAEAWLREAPASLHELGRELRATAGTGTLEELRELGEEVEAITSMNEAQSGVQRVRIEGPGLLGSFAVGLELFATSVFITFLTTFFLLSAGDSLGRRLVSLASTRQGRQRIGKFLRAVRREVSVYLNTVTVINICLGIAVALAMWLIGVPNPALWGVMVAIFNFAPYLGALVSAFVLTVVGVTTFDTLGQALLVPALFLGITTIEGSVITPMILGRRVSLNSLTVFLSVVFWGWLWGPAGALMAVPVTATLSLLWAHVKEALLSRPDALAEAPASPPG